MTKDEALKLALKALETAEDCIDGYFGDVHLLIDDAFTAIKEALAQPEHGWTPERIAGMARLKDAQDKRLAQPEQNWIEQERAVGYREGHMAALSQRTWVGLTDEEISELIRATHNTGSFVRAIEAKLKAKNT